MYALVELIVNLLRLRHLRQAYEGFKADFPDFDWRPTAIVLGVIFIVVAALAVTFALLAQ